ncbi:unnamed protein product [Closterium sp. NIES-65]|nr:unnamed protein product [Closterium sp. NIES-65]
MARALRRARTTSNRRKAGTARSQEDARTARSGKRSRDPDLEDDEGREEPAATGPGPVSSDDDPNEALPRVNPRVDGDEDATQEEASDSAPVTRAGDDGAAQDADGHGSYNGTAGDGTAGLAGQPPGEEAQTRGMPFASGAFAACARAAFRPRMVNGTLTLKLYHMAWLEHVVTDAIRFWDTRKGRLSNSAGVNAQIVDGLRECALVDVMAAIEQYQLQYDPTTSSWAWGRHGLRLSADGVERQEPAKQAHSESDG